MTKTKQVEVLLVEDNPGDVLLVKEAIREVNSREKVHVAVHVAETGAKAMECLHQKGGFEEFPRPHLIILDLNLPVMDGYEVLDKIKKSENLRRIPVVVLTASRADKDVLKSYNLHANCYIIKPVDQKSFAGLVETIETFWLKVAMLPPDTMH